MISVQRYGKTPTYDLSSSSGAGFGAQNSTAAFVTVTNLSVSLTTLGFPVSVGICHDGSTNKARFYMDASSGTANNCYFAYRILEGGTIIALEEPGFYAQNHTGVMRFEIPPSISVLYVPPAGSYTWYFQTRIITTGTVYSRYLKMFAIEHVS